MSNGRPKTSPKKKNGNHKHNDRPNHGGNGKDVNWIEEWSEKPIKVPSGVTKAKFKKAVKDYLRAWLAAQNIFQTNPKKRHTLKRLNVELKPGTQRTYIVTALLKPSAKRPTVKPPKGHGGGHMIPHDPPPPPPGR